MHDHGVSELSICVNQFRSVQVISVATFKLEFHSWIHSLYVNPEAVNEIKSKPLMFQ